MEVGRTRRNRRSKKRAYNRGRKDVRQGALPDESTGNLGPGGESHDKASSGDPLTLFSDPRETRVDLAMLGKFGVNRMDSSKIGECLDALADMTTSDTQSPEYRLRAAKILMDKVSEDMKHSSRVAAQGVPLVDARSYTQINSGEEDLDTQPEEHPVVDHVSARKEKQAIWSMLADMETRDQVTGSER